ncbi:MAG TPA: DUF4398 domain-containing protein [Polyangiaceae bacterium]
MKGFAFAALVTVAFTAGCGSSALPPAKFTDTKAAISAAEAVGAPNSPQGALHLKLAKDQLKNAEALIEEDEHEQARLVLERARADAELARLITEREQEQLQANQAMERVRELE